ncbi:MAG: XisI protein, partial [Chloroflexaceae bacterium]|nr:XisI protein [Chloroflexaceae bacterium]
MDVIALIKTYIAEQLNIPISHGAITLEAMLDDQQQRYALVSVGWNETQRIQALDLYVAIRDGKLYIEHDGTPAPGIVAYLLDHGVPQNMIVLASQHPRKR